MTNARLSQAIRRAALARRFASRQVTRAAQSTAHGLVRTTSSCEMSRLTAIDLVSGFLKAGWRSLNSAATPSARLSRRFGLSSASAYDIRLFSILTSLPRRRPRGWSCLHASEGDGNQCSSMIISNNAIGPSGKLFLIQPTRARLFNDIASSTKSSLDERCQHSQRSADNHDSLAQDTPLQAPSSSASETRQAPTDHTIGQTASLSLARRAPSPATPSWTLRTVRVRQLSLKP